MPYFFMHHSTEGVILCARALHGFSGVTTSLKELCGQGWGYIYIFQLAECLLIMQEVLVLSLIFT